MATELSTENELGFSDSMTFATSELQLSTKCSRFMHKMFPIGFSAEFKEVCKLAWPAIFTSFFQLFLQTISIIMCGHLEKNQMDAAGLANSMINVFGISIGMGMSTCCDTFFSQTFGGEEKWRVGIYLQRSLIIMNCVAIIVCCIHINILPILLLLGQNVEIATLTADYMLHFFPGVFFDYNFLIMARYLQNQNVVYPSLVCAAIGNVVNIVSQYVCIHVFKFSYLASAVCQASSLAVMMITQLIYILVSKVYKTTWTGFNFNEAIRGWGMFFKLAIPGLLMVGLEEWGFEISTFLAGTIDPIQLGIQTIMFQIESITYMLPLGASIAINIRVGQHLGGGRPDNAKASHRVGLALILMTSTVLAIIVLALRNYIPYIFTSDEVIAEGVSSVLILTAGFLFGDGIAGTSGGALRGCGRQLTGAIILFIGYYVIALPIGISLALKTELKVFGMWVGLLVGISIEAIIFLVVVGRTNWNRCCERAALVAYGGEAKKNELAPDFTCYRQSLKENEMISKISESEPLLGSRNRTPGTTTSYSRRAIISIADRPEEEEVNRVSEEPLRRVLMKRAIFALFIVAWVTAGITIRIFQQTPCYPVNNSTMPEYTGIVPLCNETSL